MVVIKIIDAYTDASKQWFICVVINLFFRALATILLDGLKSKMTEKPGSDGYG